VARLAVGEAEGAVRIEGGTKFLKEVRLPLIIVVEASAAYSVDARLSPALIGTAMPDRSGSQSRDTTGMPFRIA
jgi:hypothetical protein